ncbi:hypothetical protein IKQ21_06425 [bacterium]|nr:hypothetical protein [bacterium]
MRVNCIQSNQQNFGTKVKINKKLKKSFSSKDGGAALNEYIKTLESNGNRDNFVISYTINKHDNTSFHADVLKMKGAQLYVGKSIELNIPPDGCPNLAKLYLEASQNFHPFMQRA